MARGRSQSGVKSHRRGRRRQVVRRRLPVAPWIVMTTVAALVTSGMVAGYAWLLGTGCSGDPVNAVLAAPEEISGTLQTAARAWANTDPAVDGNCIGVEVVDKSSANMVTELSSGTSGSEKDMPHIWVPESTAWLNMAKISDRGKEIIPKTPPLIATSPTVIAMPEPAAKALGWRAGDDPKEEAGKPTWANLTKLVEKSDWGTFGKDEWGDITVGMSDPMASTADLHALLSIVDKDHNATVNPGELSNVSELRGTVAKQTDSVDKMMDNMKGAGDKGKPVGYVSAFPALERDVWFYNTYSEPSVPLTAVYPADGSLDADHPFAILQDVSWTDKRYQEIGRQFAEYLTGEGQKTVKDAGFRDGTRRDGSKTLTDTEGLTGKIDEPQLDAAYPDSVQTTLAAWQALARPANILLVVDSSASMVEEEVYDGDRLSRIEIIRNSLADSLKLLGDKTEVGLWRYPFNPGGGQPFQELVNIGEFDSSRQDLVESSLDSISPSADGGLNDTVVESYRSILNHDSDEKDAANIVLVISDGGDESASGTTAEDATQELKELAADNRDKDASIMTIGYGSEADKDQLDGFASATGGEFYSVKWSDEINTQVLNALYYS